MSLLLRNFVGADKELQAMFRGAFTFYKDAASLLAQDNVDWVYIPPYAPHFGGLWESGVKSVKNHIKGVIGDQSLTSEELSTFLCQIEAYLNSRRYSTIQWSTWPGPAHSRPSFTRSSAFRYPRTGFSSKLSKSIVVMEINLKDALWFLVQVAFRVSPPAAIKVKMAAYQPGYRSWSALTHCQRAYASRQVAHRQGNQHQ